MRLTVSTPDPRSIQSTAVCDRCGDVSVGDVPCRCRTPYDQAEVDRRHRDAVQGPGRAVAGGGALETRRREIVGPCQGWWLSSSRSPVVFSAFDGIVYHLMNTLNCFAHAGHRPSRPRCAGGGWRSR